MTKEEYKIIFKEYYSALAHFACDLLGDRQGAEDVVQEVFVKLWDRREQIDLSNNVKSYLYQSVKHKSFDVLKARKHSTLSLDSKTVEESVVVEPTYGKMDEYLLKEQISNSLRQLPPRCYDIFVLSKVQGLSHKEISQKLEISVKTIENQMTKAYRILRELLKDKLPIRR